MHNIKDFYFFLNSNKRIEQLFGILRSMIGGNMNFDCLDLRDRLADGVLVQWISTLSIRIQQIILQIDYQC